MFKKIKKGIRRNFKRVLISCVAIISAMVIFIIPASAFTGWQEVNLDISNNLRLTCFNVYYSKSSSGPWSQADIGYNSLVNDGVTFIYLDTKDGTFDPYYYRFIYWFEVKNFNSANAHRIQFDVTSGLLQTYTVDISHNNVSYIAPDNTTQISGTFSVVTDGNNSTDACYRFDSGVIEPEFSFGKFEDYGNLTCRSIFQLPRSTDSLLIRIDNVQFSEISPFEYPSYSPPDSGSINNHNKVESNVVDGTAGGLNEADKIFSSADTLFDSSTSFAKGLMSATKIFNVFLGVDIFDDVLRLSLTLGIFAFLLGVVPAVSSFFAGKDRRQAAEQRRQNRNRKGG